MAENFDMQVSMMVSSIKEKFKQYWEGPSKINKLLIVIYVLDLRRKMNFATLWFEIIYGNDNAKCAEMKNMVKDLLNKFFKAYNAQH